MFAAKLRAAAFGAIVIAAFPALANAAVYAKSGQPASFDVTLRINAGCAISANGLDFGQQQGVLSSTVAATANIRVTCSNTTPYNIGLDQGTGPGSSGTTRYMRGTGSNTETIQFNLYQAQGGTPWGATQGNNTLAGTGNGTAQNLTVYGEIPAQNTPTPDNYK
jgi:spore coat protein U-like protein